MIGMDLVGTLNAFGTYLKLLDAAQAAGNPSGTLHSVRASFCSPINVPSNNRFATYTTIMY
jgi:hypothetical protein